MGNRNEEAAFVGFRSGSPLRLLGKYARVAPVATGMARTCPRLRLYRNRNSCDDSSTDVLGDRNLVEKAFGWKEFPDCLMLGLT